MTDWIKHWSAIVEAAGENKYLLQVGHQLNGKPYSSDQFAHMVFGIKKALDLRTEDVLLDLCCGNGLLTKELASECKSVVGVDFSESLIRVANTKHFVENTKYHVLDVHHLNELSSEQNGSFTKISMFGALQYFSPKELPMILQHVLGLSARKCLIFLGSIPDMERKKNYLNTPARRLKYLWYQFTGTDIIGTWWLVNQICSVCETYGLECHIELESSDAPISHYRFDATIIRNER